MTCDNGNGSLECLLDNNNVSNGKVANGGHKQNGSKMNGTKPVVQSDDDIETRKSLIILLTIFVLAAVAMLYIYKTFPELEE